MALGKLPRIQRGIAIVDATGRALDYFLRLLDQAFTMIERSDARQDELLATQQAQLAFINEALTLAGIAIAGSGGNSETATTEIDMTPSAWVLGPVVDLTGVVAGDVTIPSSGLYAKGTTTAFFGDTNGQVRLVEIVGGVDTIIGGPWNFTISRVDPNPAGAVYVGNAAEINTFTQARTTTGAVSYRIDARMTDGDVNNIDLKLFAKRSL